MPRRALRVASGSAAARKRALAALGCVLLLGLASAMVKASAYLEEQRNYVEVAGDRTAYVPGDAQFVKYHGQVRRIVRWASSLGSDPKDCKCPRCCDGMCYITIYSDKLPDDKGASAPPAGLLSDKADLGKGAAILLLIIWINC